MTTTSAGRVLLQRGRARVRTEAARLRRAWGERDRDIAWWIAFGLAAFLALGSAGLMAALVLWALHIQWNPPSPTLGVLGLLALGTSGVAWLLGGVPTLDSLHTAPQRPVATLFAIAGVLFLLVAAWRAPDGTASTPDLRAQLHRVGATVRHLLVPVEGPGRLPETALMRAIALPVVVWVHALPAGFALGRLPSDRWLGDVTRFAVPVFVFVAGYLVERQPTPRGWTRRRFERLLIPYLTVSALAIGLRSWSDAFAPMPSPLADLLVGATFGPYYFVLVMVALTLVTHPLRRLRGRAAGIVLALAVVAQVIVEVAGGPLFWRVRNPLLWLAFYLAGMLVHRHRTRLAAHAESWPTVLLGWSVVVTVLLAVPDDTPARDVLTMAAAWVMVAVLWLAGCASQRRPRLAWWIDRATYPLYLYHVPFVLLVVGPLGASVLSPAAVAGWTMGMIGAASVLVIGRHVLGPAAPRVLGA